MNTQLRQGGKKKKKGAKQSHQGHRQLPGKKKKTDTGLERGYPETQREAKGRQRFQKQQEEAMVDPELHQGAGAARRQLSRHNWIRDNSAPAVRGCDSHTE